MFRDLPRHAAYKSNSSPWLGDLPAHWSLARVKTLLTERSQKGYPDEPLLAATQSHGVIRKSDYETRTVTATKDLHLLKLVKVGDFVISLRSFQGGIERCYHRGIISPAYTVLTAHDDSYRDYLTYLFKSSRFIDSLTLAVTGIREGQNIDYSRLAVDLLPVPPVEEQAAIVKYLAHANARIDNAINAKRRLIALLEEQRSGIVNSIVLGHRIGGELRQEPGHAWLEAVPTDWDVAPLKRYWTVTDCKHLTVPFTDEGIPLASVSQAQRFLLDLSDAKLTDQESYENLIEGGRKPQKGDLIYCRNVGVGAAAVVETEETFAMGQDVCLLRSRDQNPYFLNHYLQSSAMQAQLELILVGSTFRRINVEDVRGLVIVVPSVTEQNRLVEQINQETEPLAQTVRKAQLEIGLLLEFRTRLVADVVTGQIDVRAISASLPDDPVGASMHEVLTAVTDDDFDTDDAGELE